MRMQHEPRAISQKQRNWSYWMMWIGAGCALIMLFMYFVMPSYQYPGPIVGGAVGGMIGAIIPNPMDEYFRRLCAIGARCVTAFMSLILLTGWIMIDLFDDGTPSSALSRALSDPVLLGILAALAYYMGFIVAWLIGEIAGKLQDPE